VIKRNLFAAKIKPGPNLQVWDTTNNTTKQKKNIKILRATMSFAFLDGITSRPIILA
jgi:hypothetical protein